MLLLHFLILYIPASDIDNGVDHTMKTNAIMPIAAGLLIVIAACTPQKPPAEFLSRVQKIENQWAPDKRLCVSNIDYRHQDGKWVISGETSVPEIKNEIEKAAEEIIGPDQAVSELVLLPDSSLDDKIAAVVDVSVGNLRKQPKHGAEMVDQVIMGNRLKLLKKKGYWYLVQTEYGYIGWITSGGLVRMTNAEADEWQSTDKIEITANFAQLYEEPSESSAVVADLALNCIMTKKTERKGWVEVLLAGGRTGFVKNENARSFNPVANNENIDRVQLINKARTLMGVPYLWGGHSSKGVDCSGFTSTVFRSFGYQLPRDANMQVLLGEEITPGDDWQNVLPGDLLFFGHDDRITHVAISLGGALFIHSSDYVQLNSLDENDPLYNEYRKKSIRTIKRIIKN